MLMISPTAEGAFWQLWRTRRIFGMEEPLGLKIVHDGNTILM
jgi:hypothetical protein